MKIPKQSKKPENLNQKTSDSTSATRTKIKKAYHVELSRTTTLLRSKFLLTPEGIFRGVGHGTQGEQTKISYLRQSYRLTQERGVHLGGKSSLNF